MKIKIQVLLIMIGMLFLGSAVQGSFIAYADEARVGFLDLATLFDGYQKTQKHDSVLQKKGESKEGELKSKLDELKTLRESLELLNDEARESRRREIEEKADDLKRFRTNTARDLQQERDQLAKDILNEIRVIIEEYAAANEFAMILDGRQVLYGISAYDVTDEVLAALNTKFAAQENSE